MIRFFCSNNANKSVKIFSFPIEKLARYRSTPSFSCANNFRISLVRVVHVTRFSFFILSKFSIVFLFFCWKKFSSKNGVETEILISFYCMETVRHLLFDFFISFLRFFVDFISFWSSFENRLKPIECQSKRWTSKKHAHWTQNREKECQKLLPNVSQKTKHETIISRFNRCKKRLNWKWKVRTRSYVRLGNNKIGREREKKWIGAILCVHCAQNKCKICEMGTLKWKAIPLTAHRLQFVRKVFSLGPWMSWMMWKWLALKYSMSFNVAPLIDIWS